MALDTFIAGAYVGTYNAVGVGMTDQGFTIDQSTKQEMIDESDAYGNTTLDWIYRGGDAFLQFTSKAYKTGSISPFWPWGGGLGQIATSSKPIGVLASAIAQAMVLTVTANTPAVSAPNTLTAPATLLAPNFNASLLFDSRLRKVPVRLQMLPYVASGGLFWFALT